MRYYGPVSVTGFGNCGGLVARMEHSNSERSRMAPVKKKRTAGEKEIAAENSKGSVRTRRVSGAKATKVADGAKCADRDKGTKAASGPGPQENTIIQGDCVAVLAEQLARHGGEGFVDLVFADPPFNIGYEYDKYHDKVDYDEYVDWTRQWMTACCEVLADHGSFWIAIGDDYAAEVRIAARQLGLVMRNWIIWYYTFGQCTKKKFARSHTHIFYFVKDASNFIFNDQAIRVPSARQTTYNDKRANAKGKLPDDTWILRPQEMPEAFGLDEDTWHISRVCGTFKERMGFHGCQMPELLLERIIETASKPGQMVLDPFSGSGTTVTVAAQLGRRFLGIDLSENYVEQGLRRLKESRGLFDVAEA